MSDDEEIEAEGNEGEGEEGGESEDEKEEVKEEVKETPPPPRYIPKINPLTHLQNINRDLDMLNSEVNVLSSQFMVFSSSMAPSRTYYNTSPSRIIGPSYYNIPNPTYSSPIMPSGGQTSYWNNPNHISLSSPTRVQPAFYNVSDNYMGTTSYSYTSPSFGGGYGRTSYSPPKYPTATYTSPYPSAINPINNQRSFSPYKAPQLGDYNYGQLLNNIDNVLSKSPPRKYVDMHNTFERDTVSFRPNFQMHTQYEPKHTFTESATKPPLYQKPRSYSQNREQEITSMNDFYNRKSGLDRYNINNSHRPITPYVKPTSPLRNTHKQSPHFNRTHRSVHRPANEFEIKDAIHTLFR